MEHLYRGAGIELPRELFDEKTSKPVMPKIYDKRLKELYVDLRPIITYLLLSIIVFKKRMVSDNK